MWLARKGKSRIAKLVSFCKVTPAVRVRTKGREKMDSGIEVPDKALSASWE